MTSMVCFQVMGYDQAIALAAQAGQLELNVMMPLIAYDLIHDACDEAFHRRMRELLSDSRFQRRVAEFAILHGHLDSLAQQGMLDVDPEGFDVMDQKLLRTIIEGVLLNSMYDLPSLDNVSKVVVDETVIEGEAEPYILYENNETQQAAAAD